MKIVITGATGFIGRNLAEQLHKDQVEVISTGRSLKVGDDLQKLGITFLPADLCNQSNLVKMIPSADCLIHCAGKAGDGGRFQDFYDTNSGIALILSKISQLPNYRENSVGRISEITITKWRRY